MLGGAGAAAYLLRQLGQSGWLAGSVLKDVPVFRWQLLNSAAMALNLYTVALPGRLDGEAAERLRKEQAGGEAGKGKALPPPDAMMGRSLFTPSGYAFAIWGPIFLGETLFNFILQYLIRGDAPREVLATAAPWWATCCVCQSLWCFTFRPRYRPRLLLVPATLLGAGAGAIGCWHGVLRSWQACDLAGSQPPLVLMGLVPTSMHFGWLMAATLVNTNGALAYAPTLVSEDGMTALACLSGVVGAGAATVMGLRRASPTVAGVGAWALLAVANDMKRRTNGERPGYAVKGAKAVETVCYAGTSLCLGGMALALWADVTRSQIPFVGRLFGSLKLAC